MIFFSFKLSLIKDQAVTFRQTFSQLALNIVYFDGKKVTLGGTVHRMFYLTTSRRYLSVFLPLSFSAKASRHQG
jgi:hypothetical protein